MSSKQTSDREIQNALDDIGTHLEAIEAANSVLCDRIEAVRTARVSVSEQLRAVDTAVDRLTWIVVAHLLSVKRRIDPDSRH